MRGSQLSSCTFLLSRFAPHLEVVTYGSGGKEVREGQREEIASHVSLQPGGWSKASSYPFQVMLCHYEVTVHLCHVHNIAECVVYFYRTGLVSCYFHAGGNKRCYFSEKVSFISLSSPILMPLYYYRNSNNMSPGFHGNA